ncbi:MAG: hypothetical protein CVT73_00545, partial [Alphaproteobacteria bacterium HGW-Alphaproteobacteria-12]
GALTPARGGGWHGLLSPAASGGDTGIRVAVFLKAVAPDKDIAVVMRGLAGIAALAAVRIRGEKAAALERRRFSAVHEATRHLLDLDADIVWDAAADGIVHCRRVLNRRGDLGRLTDGMDMNALRIGDGEQSLLDCLAQSTHVRRRRVHLPDNRLAGLPSGETLYVSAMVSASGGAGEERAYTGTFAAIGADGGALYTREAAAMLVRMRGARLREEQQRREAEAMLQGLRLLLGQDSSREKMMRLVELIGECIAASDACVVERALDGSVRRLVPQQRRLGSGADAALATIAGGAAGRAVAVYDVDTAEGESIARAFGLDGAQIAILPLPLRGEAAFLVCTTRRPEGFAAADLDFADRFTLLLRQALLLREEQAQLAQTAKMAALGQMSASIAHELRQPLNTISLAVQNLEILLEAPEVDGEAAAGKVKRVLAQVERASGVIDRMRRFGRKSVGDHAVLDLAGIVENIEAIMHHVLLRAGVRIEVEIAESLTVYADPLQLEQVIANLIQNAVDAISGIGAKHDREEGLVRIIAAPVPDEEDMVSLRIEDSGPGFRPEILERVLEPFFTTKSAEHGTGLGLAICDAIVRESGGRLEVGNHPSGGYVAIVLPRAQA